MTEAVGRPDDGGDDDKHRQRVMVTSGHFRPGASGHDPVVNSAAGSDGSGGGCLGDITRGDDDGGPGADAGGADSGRGSGGDLGYVNGSPGRGGADGRMTVEVTTCRDKA